MERKRIAQASADASLAHSREQVLTMAGFAVRTLTDVEELAVACRQERFDLLIVGHLLEYRSRQDIAQAFRKLNPGAPIVQLVSMNEPAGEVDYVFDIHKGPDALLALLSTILLKPHSQSFGISETV
jgi:DNA-binding response OmpR family regulator